MGRHARTDTSSSRRTFMLTPFAGPRARERTRTTSHRLRPPTSRSLVPRLGDVQTAPCDGSELGLGRRRSRRAYPAGAVTPYDARKVCPGGSVHGRCPVRRCDRCR
jgi:hypothetical protein